MKILIDNGHGRETAGKRAPDGDADQEAAFYILKHTACASCLTENGFMDCRRSCDFLLSDEGKDAITQLHVDGILSYVRACE
jgi:N-acetylmuramoyl-L-alanine amidase